MNDRVAEIMWKCTVPTEQSEEYSNSKGLVNDVSHKLDIGKFANMLVLDIHQYVDSMDTAQVISNGILKRYGVEV
jgi:hypothetical protein